MVDDDAVLLQREDKTNDFFVHFQATSKCVSWPGCYTVAGVQLMTRVFARPKDRDQLAFVEALTSSYVSGRMKENS